MTFILSIKDPDQKLWSFKGHYTKNELLITSLIDILKNPRTNYKKLEISIEKE